VSEHFAKKIYFRHKVETMKKSVLITIGVCIAIFSLQAFTTYDRPEWKNLHVLPQDISKDGLDSVMHSFTRSLGVKCGYCHARSDDGKGLNFPSDAKPEKQIARKMMEMCIDINKNHFVQIEEAMDKSMVPPSDTTASSYMLKYVTCYTCHHGSPHPDNKPPMEPEQGMGQAPQPK